MATSQPLTPIQLDFLAETRRAVLATAQPGGRPLLVPICYVVLGSWSGLRIYTPLDDKPKRVGDAHDLERVRNIIANPQVSLLVDRWSEDWSRLGWLRLDGRAEVIEPGEAGEPGAGEHESAVEALRGKYAQYATHRLEDRPIIRVTIERARSWGDLAAG
jgi:PPOX class probable F420-dependent enzyme